MLKLTLSLLFMSVSCGMSSGYLLESKEPSSALSIDAQKFIETSTSLNNSDAGQLMQLVEKHNASKCLARVICELIANNTVHGEAGMRFGRALLKFRDIKSPEAEFYQKAIKVGSKNQQKYCISEYGECSYSSQEIIDVGIKVLNV